MSLSTKAMLACLLGSLWVVPSVAVPADRGTAKAEPQMQKETEEKRKALMADATSAIQETQAALKTSTRVRRAKRLLRWSGRRASSISSWLAILNSNSHPPASVSPPMMFKAVWTP